MSVLEQALLLARRLPWPGAWAWLELAAAVAAGALFFWRCRGKRELRRAFVYSLPLAAIGAALLGSALRLLGAGPAHDAFGLSSYGALVGMASGFLLLSRRSPLSSSDRLLLLSPALLLLAALGRLGCFAAGCEPGAVTAAPWGTRFPRGTSTFRQHVSEGWVLPSDAWSLAVHPVQLYEAALVLGLLVLVLALERRARPQLTVASLVVGYAATRFAVSLYRV